MCYRTQERLDLWFGLGMPWCPSGRGGGEESLGILAQTAAPGLRPRYMTENGWMDILLTNIMIDI